MKHFKNLTSIFLSLLILASCQQPEEYEPNCITPAKIEDYLHLGEWHNNFLSNVADNFDTITIIANPNYNQRINYIKDFHINYVDSMGLDSINANIVKSEFNRTRRFVDSEYAYSVLYDNEEIVLGMDLSEAIDDLLLLGKIDNFEKSLIDTILQLVEDQYHGTISWTEFQTELIGLKNSWNAQGYTECDSTGKLSAMILIIGLNSIEWWIDNTDVASEFESRAAPAWVALDVGGAVVGGVSGAIGSHYFGGGFSWGAVGWGAFAGGVAASTGAARIIGRFIVGGK